MIYLKNDTSEQNVYVPRTYGNLSVTKANQEKTVEFTEPGTYEILPDQGYKGLSKVIVKVI